MLVRLEIRNFAVIEHAVFEPCNGFNAVTGETGAGKSLLIDAITLVSGKKANRDIIRSDSDFALVEAVFDVSDIDENSEFIKFLDENSIVIEDHTIIISRRISRDGKSIARINGSTVLLSVLKNLSDYIIDIHGQHDTQIIFDEKKHIDLLDAYGRKYIEQPYAEYVKKLNELKECTLRIKKLSDNSNSLGNEDFLRCAVKEISDADLHEGEEEELDIKLKEYTVLKQTAVYWKIINDAFNSADDNGITPIDRVEAALDSLNRIKSIDDKLVDNDFYDRFSGLVQSFEDINAEVTRYLELSGFDENELSKLEDRISLIFNLKNKYGKSIEEILEFETNANSELLGLENKEKTIRELKLQRQKLSEELLSASDKLNSARKLAADELSSRIVSELADLNMENSRFEVIFKEHDKNRFFSAKGSQDVAFCFSSNKGEELKPLSGIVSGGEASRIMLAIKVILSDSDSLSTMIFDEIDTGVSGIAANKIAEKLKFLGKKHQVLCVTHLSQIAASADYNFLIEKKEKDNSTFTQITELDSNAKILEISRLLTGTQNEESIRLAENLINHFL
ncbi:MAG: DNA repair protein RecN [Clostridia bacterium]|nr:DNA repair protein RecN [Clostridia bacterium]